MSGRVPFPHQRFAWAGENLGWILMAAALLLFSTKTLFNVPIWLMACAGIWLYVGEPRRLWTGATERLIGSLFLCLWLPQMLALPDAPA